MAAGSSSRCNRPAADCGGSPTGLAESRSSWRWEAIPLSLWQMRERHGDEAKRQLAAGLDPAQEKKTADPGDSFRVLAEEYVAKLRREGRADRTNSKVNWLLSFAYPTLGDQSITIYER